MESRIPQDNFTDGRTLARPSRPSARRKKKQAHLAALDRGTSQTRRQAKAREQAHLKRDENQVRNDGPIAKRRFRPLPKNKSGSGESSKRGGAVGRLVRNGTITGDEEWAARQILRACIDIEEEYRIRPSVMERVDCGNEQDEWPRWLTSKNWKVFVPWKAALDLMHANAFDIIVNTVIWGESFKFIDRKFHKDDGFAKQVTVAGLKLYVDLVRADI